LKEEILFLGQAARATLGEAPMDRDEAHAWPVQDGRTHWSAPTFADGLSGDGATTRWSVDSKRKAASKDAFPTMMQTRNSNIEIRNKSE